MERSRNYSSPYRLSLRSYIMHTYHPLGIACFYRSHSRTKMMDAASGWGEPNDNVCEYADAPASFKPEVWKHFGFPASGNQKVEKVTDRKQYVDTVGLEIIFAHTAKFSHCLIIRAVNIILWTLLLCY